LIFRAIKPLGELSTRVDPADAAAAEGEGGSMDWAQEPFRLPPSGLGLPSHGDAHLPPYQKTAHYSYQGDPYQGGQHGVPGGRATAAHPQQGAGQAAQMALLQRVVAGQGGVFAAHAHDEAMLTPYGGPYEPARPASIAVCEQCWGTNGRHKRKCPAFLIAHETFEQRAARLRREERQRDQELGHEYVDADKQAEKTFTDYVPSRLFSTQIPRPCWPNVQKRARRHAPDAQMVSTALPQHHGEQHLQGAS
jgi:hypothetical protein